MMARSLKIIKIQIDHDMKLEVKYNNHQLLGIINQI